MKPVKTRTAPQSANELLANVKDDHNWKHDPVDLTSTGGIQRAITAQWHAIQALADYIDGVATGETDAEGKPVKRSEADEQSVELLPAAPADPARSVAAA